MTLKTSNTLPLSQRLLYYNAIIRPVLSYVSVIWSSCDKLSVNSFKVILYADRQASSAALFNKLHWIPFYEQCNIDRCSILYKRIHGSLPSHLGDHLVINHKRHSRNTFTETLISTLFALNMKEKPKVDAHLQYQLQDSGIMYPYLLGKWIL